MRLSGIRLVCPFLNPQPRFKVLDGIDGASLPM